METLTNEITITCNSDAIDSKYDIFQIKTNNKYIEKGAKALDLQYKGLLSISFDDGASAFMLFKKRSIKTYELQYMVGEDLMVKKLEICDIKPYILAKLFLVSLSSSSFEENSFNNLTGKLYLLKPEWISSNRKSFKALNFNIKQYNEDSAKLICTACTFTLTKLFKSPRIVETNALYKFSIKNTLRRAFDKEEETYIKKPINGKKAQITYLSFLKDKMNLCKSYFIHYIVELFNKEFGKDISIRFQEKEIIRKYRYEKDDDFFEKVLELLSGKTINLINMDNLPEDSAVFDDLVKKISDIMPKSIIQISPTVRSRELNIVLIHNKEYYKENNMEDPYASFDRTTPIQCVTVEDAIYKDSEAIYRTIIKELEIKNEIIFAQKFLIDDWSKYNYKTPMIFGMMVDDISYFMKVLPDGEFSFIKKSDTFSIYKEDVYNNLEKLLYQSKSDNKLLVSDCDENINIILDSGIFALPDSAIFCSPSPRGKASKENFLSGLLDINVYKGDSYQFSTGPLSNNVNTEIVNASLIYDLKVLKGHPLAMNLFQTLGVLFVKYNNFTVIPYPFKYLREKFLV